MLQVSSIVSTLQQLFKLQWCGPPNYKNPLSLPPSPPHLLYETQGLLALQRIDGLLHVTVGGLTESIVSD